MMTKDMEIALPSEEQLVILINGRIIIELPCDVRLEAQLEDWDNDCITVHPVIEGGFFGPITSIDKNSIISIKKSK